MNSKTILEIAALAAVTVGTIYIGRTIIKKAKEEKKSSFRGITKLGDKDVSLAAPITNCYCNGKLVKRVKCHPQSDCCPPCQKEDGKSFNRGYADCDGCSSLKRDDWGLVSEYEKPVWTV